MVRRAVDIVGDYISFQGETLMINEIVADPQSNPRGEFYHVLLDARSLRTAADEVDKVMPKWMGEVMRRTAREVENMVGTIQLMRIERESGSEGPSAPPENGVD
jgi:hypothetical protein